MSDKFKPVVVPFLLRTANKHFGSFLDYIRKMFIAELVIIWVLGEAVATMIRSLTTNILIPIIEYLSGVTNGFNSLSWTLGQNTGNPVIVKYGTFTQDLITFLIVASIFYAAAITIWKINDKKAEK